MAFEIHPRLNAGTFPLGVLDACHILLKNNAAFPWIIIVPEVANAEEDLHQLPPARYQAVMEVIRRVSHFVSDHFHPDKLNVACIGNQVRQMHVHVVGRSPGDPAWPATVWASDAKSAYEPAAIESIRRAARTALGLV
jgi:diadenosine tetraphosphate (Ap4A) HIT family hydrolase